MMRSDAAARRLLISLISLQTLELADAAACEGTLSPFEAYKTVKVSAPNLKSPPKSIGFNRSAALEGFFPQVSADKFECADSSSEFKANAIGSTANFYFGGKSCALSSVSVYKSAVQSGDPEVGLRLDFDSCSAAVLVGVKKNPTPVSHMVPFMRHICHKVSTTTLGGVKNVQVQKQISIGTVGDGTCVGTVAKEIPISEVANIKECMIQCEGSLLENSAADPEKACQGYAFSASGGDKACLLYAVTEVSKFDASADGYKCRNMTEIYVDVETATSAPPNLTALALKNKAPVLKVVWGADTALLEEVGPADESGCVAPFSYFTLQDEVGKKAMIPVDDDQWEEMIGYIPEPTAPTCDCPGVMTADRVAFVATDVGKTTAAMAGAWKASCIPPPPVAKPKFREEDKSKECSTVDGMISIFMGLSLPLIIWLLIGIVYFISVEVPGRPAPATPDAFSARTEADFKSGTSEKAVLLPGASGTIAPNPCSPTIFLIMVVVTIIGSLLLAWFGVEFLSVMLSSMGCVPSFHDLLLIKLAAALATMVAIILGLRYMKDEKYDRPKQEMLVLGRIAEDGSQGALLDDKFYYHGLVNRIEGGPDNRFRIT